MKKSRQSVRGGQHAKPYEATIEGKKCQVNCFDAQGNLVLADGQRFSCERLKFIPPGQPPVEPEGDIFGWRLLEIVGLCQWQGDWKWNVEQQLLSQWLDAEDKESGDPSRVLEQPDFFKRVVAKSRLDALPPTFQKGVRAVAWFAHDDGAGGWNTPILLKSFRRIAHNAQQGKLATARKEKPVARFENDFAIAVIPQRNQKELSLTIEPELQHLVKRIIEEGGHVPRTRLRSGKTDTWQPEKLLRSTVAKALIKAGLLGTKKSGRTTVFWAKEQVG